jgi:hypothetical protein
MSKGKFTYFRYFFKNAPSSLAVKVFHQPKKLTRFNGVKGIDLEKTDAVLQNCLQSDKPFCAVHFGGTELGALNNYEKIRLGLRKHYKKSVRYSMKNNAGFYPTDDKSLSKFGQTWLSECKDADVLGLMGLHMEDYFQDVYLPHSALVLYEGMEPLRGHWTRRLEGKKVLVITPFADEVKDQYARREKLFLDEPEILPLFNLRVLRSPMTLGDESGVSPSFFDGLEKMKDEIRHIDFDVALVGCGAYTSFLCFFIKSIGKQAVQTGGATQTLFGIMGKRWENRDHVAKHVNKDWIRPYKKACGYAKIESGAYW